MNAIAKIYWKLLLVLLAQWVFLPSSVRSELLPEEVAVLAVESDPNSMKVARHYLSVRSIPEENLLLLSKSYPTDLPRTVWEEEVQPAIRRWLALHPEIRCVVCAWSVPLRITAPDASSSRLEERKAFYASQEIALRDEVGQKLKAANTEVAPTDESRAAAEKLPDLAGLDLQGWLTLLQQTVYSAKERIQTLSSEDERKVEAQKLDKILQPCLGLTAIQNVMVAQAQKNAPVKPEVLMKIVQAVRILEQRLVDLNFDADTQKRDGETLKIVKVLNGPYAAMLYAREFKNRLDRNEGASSFDGELSLIFETEKYPLIGWTPNMAAFPYNLPPRIQISLKSESSVPAPQGLMENPDAPASDEATEALPAPPLGQQVLMEPPEMDFSVDSSENSAKNTAPAETPAVGKEGFRIPEPRRRVLFVSRLEGPSVETVLRRLDEGIEAEKNGLEGTIYLDARTTRPVKATVGSYAKMEQSLNDLGIRLQRYTTLNVQLDTQDALFRREDCTESCALYCGWYSVRNFQDIFTFSPGAVAWHIASFEAESLKTGPFWCPNLIEHGVVATCGPTFEPYLAAFPEPDEFFSLVLTGKFTMVECYYYTTPFLSWAMTCVGDPLYTPYRKNPKLQLNELPNNLQRFFGLQP